MSFIAVALALLLEQVRPMSTHSVVQSALRGWTRFVRRNLDAGQDIHGWLAWGAAVVGPAALAWLVHLALARTSVLLEFVWLVAVLYVTLGFRQFSHHFTDIRQALEVGDELAARKGLADWLHVEVASLPRAEVLRQVIEQSVLAAHRHVFGVLVTFLVFWWLGFGPAGAILYRLAEYLSRNWRERPDGTPSPALRRVAAHAWQIIDFLPVRVTALGFAVVGNFEEALASWRTETERHGEGNDAVMLAAASGALNVRLSPKVPGTEGENLTMDGATRAEPQLAHLASAVGLVWRSVVLWMFLLALLTLAVLHS